MDWKTDRERLRQIIREKAKEGGQKATFLFTLISHMRGRIHMKYYNKYHGGWRGYSVNPEKKEIPKEFKKAYGECARGYYYSAAIETLEDQEGWIRKYAEWFKSDEELFELANRVLDAYNDREDACVA